jgi:hypothetical protein
MCEQLRVVVRPAERVDPPGGATVLLRPCAAQKLAVRGIAKQHMLKRVLRVTRDGRPPLASDELLPFERAKELFRVTPRGLWPRPRRRARRSFRGRRLPGEVPSRPSGARRGAAMIPCTDSGSSAAVPRSASIRTYCSAKSGLPPARSSKAR